MKTETLKMIGATMFWGFFILSTLLCLFNYF